MRDRFPWIVGAFYALLFTILGTIKYNVHRNFVDFGIFAQTIAGAFGCFCNPVEGSHWAFHFSPILYIAAAVLALARSPVTLVALTAVPCALVIPPLYAIARSRADRSTARLVAVVVFLYPALAGLAFNDFHENVFAPAAVAWAVWAFDAGHLTVAAVAAIAAIATKEDQAIFMGIAGTIAAIAYRGTKRAAVAAAVAGVGFACAALFFVWIQPHAQANPQWAPARFYSWNAGDVAALFPGGVFARLGFFILAFLPLAFLPFRSPVMWLAAAPLAEVLFSRMATTYTMGSHYAGAWMGYALAAFAFAAAALRESHRKIVLYACVALCVVELLVANPLHPGLNLRPVQERDRVLDARLQTLPRDVSLATQEEAYTHLALRDPFARLLPDDSRQPLAACFVLLDRDFPDSPRLQEYGAAFDGLVRTRSYERVGAARAIELYRRRGACR